MQGWKLRHSFYGQPNPHLLRGIFTLSYVQLKCISLLFNFFYLLQYLLCLNPLPTYNF